MSGSRANGDMGGCAPDSHLLNMLYLRMCFPGGVFASAKRQLRMLIPDMLLPARRVISCGSSGPDVAVMSPKKPKSNGSGEKEEKQARAVVLAAVGLSKKELVRCRWMSNKATWQKKFSWLESRMIWPQAAEAWGASCALKSSRSSLRKWPG